VTPFILGLGKLRQLVTINGNSGLDAHQNVGPCSLQPVTQSDKSKYDEHCQATLETGDHATSTDRLHLNENQVRLYSTKHDLVRSFI
jgi:hypothetical protein